MSKTKEFKPFLPLEPTLEDTDNIYFLDNFVGEEHLEVIPRPDDFTEYLLSDFTIRSYEDKLSKEVGNTINTKNGMKSLTICSSNQRG